MLARIKSLLTRCSPTFIFSFRDLKEKLYWEPPVKTDGHSRVMTDLLIY